MSHLPAISVVDICALVIIVINIVIGIRRGLSGELSALIGMIVAFLLGLHFLAPFSAWLGEHTKLEAKTAHAIAFASVAFGIIVTTILLRLLLGKIMKITFEPSIDKFGGFLSGLSRACILILIVLITIIMYPNKYLNEKVGDESFTGRFVVKYVMPRIENASEIKEIKSEAASTMKDLDRRIEK